MCCLIGVKMNIIKIILMPLQWLFEGLIYFYKGCISPLLPHGCIYMPTCSTYTLKAIKSFGVIRGTILGAKRIMRCTPRHAGGVDPVPDNIKGDSKWLV